MKILVEFELDATPSDLDDIKDDIENIMEAKVLKIEVLEP